MLEIEHVSKSYGKNVVLKDVNLKVNQGDIVAILGSRGTGKTVLLKSINCLHTVDSGRITIDGYSVDCRHYTKRDIAILRRKTAMVFQHYHLFKNRTVLENVMQGLITVKKLPRKKAKERAIKELDKVGMTGKIKAFPSQLSGDQKLRVGIARNLALDPKVILVDEPTSALVLEKEGEVLSVIKKVAKEGNTMLIVTHQIPFARSIANHIVFMDRGEIVEEGSTNEFFLNPKEERTKQFLKEIDG